MQLKSQKPTKTGKSSDIEHRETMFCLRLHFTFELKENDVTVNNVNDVHHVNVMACFDSQQIVWLRFQHISDMGHLSVVILQYDQDLFSEPPGDTDILNQADRQVEKYDKISNVYTFTLNIVNGNHWSVFVT